jgi:hypothetical protein
MRDSVSLSSAVLTLKAAYLQEVGIDCGCTTLAYGIVLSAVY